MMNINPRNLAPTFGAFLEACTATSIPEKTLQTFRKELLLHTASDELRYRLSNGNQSGTIRIGYSHPSDDLHFEKKHYKLPHDENAASMRRAGYIELWKDDLLTQLDAIKAILANAAQGKNNPKKIVHNDLS